MLNNNLATDLLLNIHTAMAEGEMVR